MAVVYSLELTQMTRVDIPQAIHLYTLHAMGTLCSAGLSVKEHFTCRSFFSFAGLHVEWQHIQNWWNMPLLCFEENKLPIYLTRPNVNVCFRTFFENTWLNLFPWNSLVSDLHPKLGYSIGKFRVVWLLPNQCLVPWIKEFTLYVDPLLSLYLFYMD